MRQLLAGSGCTRPSADEPTRGPPRTAGLEQGDRNRAYQQSTHICRLANPNGCRKRDSARRLLPATDKAKRVAAMRVVARSCLEPMPDLRIIATGMRAGLTRGLLRFSPSSMVAWRNDRLPAAGSHRLAPACSGNVHEHLEQLARLRMQGLGRHRAARFGTGVALAAGEARPSGFASTLAGRRCAVTPASQCSLTG